MEIRDGQPGWLRWWFDFWINLQHPAIASFWALVAAAESLIAVALIIGFARKTIYTAGSSDIGTAIIYAVVFAGLLALSYYAGPSRYTADYCLERRYPWWWRLAELRRPAPALAPATTPEGTSAGQPRAA